VLIEKDQSNRECEKKNEQPGCPNQSP